MLQSHDNELIESIVSGVMNRLRRGSVSALSAPSGNGLGTPAMAPSQVETTITVPDHVVTEAVLVERLGTARFARFAAKAVLTPTARDYLRTHGISWSHVNAAAANGTSAVLAIVVSDAAIVKEILSTALPSATCELLGCVDDAARLAIAEMARGQYAVTLIFTHKAHRAACLANRQSAVRAAAIRDANDIMAIASELHVNTWCLDPSKFGVFELRNAIKAITAIHERQPDSTTTRR